MVGDFQTLREHDTIEVLNFPPTRTGNFDYLRQDFCGVPASIHFLGIGKVLSDIPQTEGSEYRIRNGVE